jgi:hypothetical protein
VLIGLNNSKVGKMGSKFPRILKNRADWNDNPKKVPAGRPPLSSIIGNADRMTTIISGGRKL